jgi:hypothetical protein
MKKKVKIHYPPFIQWWIPKLLIKQFFCRHNYQFDYTLANTYCTKCNKIKPGYIDDLSMENSSEAIKAADDFIKRLKNRD